MSMSTRVNGVLVNFDLLSDGRVESHTGSTWASAYVSPKGQAIGQTLAMIDAAFITDPGNANLMADTYYQREDMAGQFCDEFGFMEAKPLDLFNRALQQGTLNLDRLAR